MRVCLCGYRGSHACAAMGGTAHDDGRERERKISQQAIQYVNTALASNQQWDFLPNNLAPARELIYNSSCNGRSRYTSRDDLRSGH